MTVYLDAIIALNWLFDSLLLYLSAIVLKRKPPLWRIFAGGFIGALLILLSVSPIQNAGHPVLKILFSILMVLMAFGYKRFRYFGRCLAVFYLMSFLLGGILTGAHYFISFDLDLSSSLAFNSIKGFGDPVSWFFVIIGFPIAWHFSRQGLSRLETAKIRFDQTVTVRLACAGHEFSFTGLVDSGNQLNDPITRRPVMIVSLASYHGRMPDLFRPLAGDPDKILSGEEQIALELESRIKFIPCRVVGRENQLLIALSPDSLQIEKGESMYQVEKALVSFTMQRLSSEDAFQCIVHPQMLMGLDSGSGNPKAG